MVLNSILFDFIKECPTAYHSVETTAAILKSQGYTELRAVRSGELVDGGKYYITRNGSSLIAFRYNASKHGFMICSSHGDSPAFKLKASGSSFGAGYSRLDVEKYGGMICYTWLDRPLSLAGRVYLKCEGGIEERLINIDRDLLVIPSVAIHMNRGVNDGYKFNPAVDMLPVLSSSRSDIFELVAAELDTTADKIAGHDLFLYCRDDGRTVGMNEDDMILAPRLDDLACVFASLKAFIDAKSDTATPVLAVFDNEEVGSETKQGAASTFLYDILSAIGGSEYYAMLDNSFMISADNAHAIHPNHPELADAHNAPVLNGGVVLKYNANQRYTTDAYSAAVLTALAERAGARVQSFANRADMPGGSTLGSISNTKVSVPTVDIGLPQLAMHSAVETAGALDLRDMVLLLTEFFSSAITHEGEKTLIVK